MAMSSYRAPDEAPITSHEVTAVVKWFNRTKGFGFVQPGDGSQDAFLHISVVEQSGNPDLVEGTTLVCDLAQGRRGLQVAYIHRIESSPDVPVRPMRDSGGGGPSQMIEGTVKFFNVHKGFGFVVPDDGSQDVFVSARVLERAGLQHLEAEQRVRLEARPGQKGPMAERVELL